MSKQILARLPDDGSLFHLLVDSVRDYAIYALDTDGRVVSWNRGARQIKGYTAEEIVGRHFSLFFSDADRANDLPGRLLAAAAEQGRTSVEGWRIRKDGTRFWGSVVITALRTDDGQLAGYAKVTRDLTDKRIAEEALQKRERQLSETQALAGLGSWEWDIAADRVSWTDELYRIFDIDPGSFGATFDAYLAMVHPDDRDRVRGIIEAAYREGGSFEFEERIVRPDGQVRSLQSRGRVTRDEDGRTTHVVGSCLDITELRVAQEKALQLVREQAAREAAEDMAERLRFLVRASEILTSSMDYEATLQAVADLSVARIANWCAIDLTQPDGDRLRVAVATADPERDEPATRISVTLPGHAGELGVLSFGRWEGGEFGDSELWLARELGRHAAAAIENARLHREVEERNRLLEEQSTELELQTEELQAQVTHNEELLAELESANDELQRRTLEAEEANRAKSDFLAAMSHELRTPLNAIFGYADLIQLGLHGPVTPAQHQALERIKRNQNALLLLINDVLNFAKLEAGGLKIDLLDVPVDAVIADLEEVVGPQLRAKELRYECRPGDAGLKARGDRERIQQILLNLLTNAIKFTDAGGSITLEAIAEGEAVRFAVSDTGCGIPEDRVEVIFDPFVQIGRQPGERGVGLGLAISRDLAEAMGGTLTVRSDIGRGSTFYLTLPRSGTAKT